MYSVNHFTGIIWPKQNRRNRRLKQLFYFHFQGSSNFFESFQRRIRPSHLDIRQVRIGNSGPFGQLALRDVFVLTDRFDIGSDFKQAITFYFAYSVIFCINFNYIEIHREKKVKITLITEFCYNISNTFFTEYQERRTAVPREAKNRRWNDSCPKWMKVGRKLKELKQLKKMKLKDIAQSTGLSVSYISDILNEKTNPSVDTLMKLTESFGVSPALVMEPESPAYLTGVEAELHDLLLDVALWPPADQEDLLEFIRAKKQLLRLHAKQHIK